MPKSLTPDRSDYFVVVSGLPASGKTTLANRLAPVLDLPVLDKDQLLTSLFARRGVGDQTWRQRLSRESDGLLREKALASRGALLVSFWHLSGMPGGSGTPVEWLSQLRGQVIHLWCRCSPEIAAERFFRRQRHPGHLDHERTHKKTLSEFIALSHFEPGDFGKLVEVDTTGEPNIASLAESIRRLALDE
jgi:thymidylate kinase